MTIKFEGLTMNQLAERNAELVTEISKANEVLGNTGFMTLSELITLTMSEKDKQIAELQRKIEALERSEKQRESWKLLAQTNISEREKDIAELETARKHIAELEARQSRGNPLSNDDIKKIFLMHGFKEKKRPNGSFDLNPYVYVAAKALIEASQLPVKLPRFSDFDDYSTAREVLYAVTEVLRTAGITVQGDE